MKRRLIRSLVAGLALSLAGGIYANPTAPTTAPTNARAASAETALPVWRSTLSFAELGHAEDLLLLGIHNRRQIDFSIRRDRLANDAQLHLEYTPSPVLLPRMSHLRIYLNEELMGVVPIEKEQLGRPVSQQVPLNPQLLTDHNRVRLEFVGHYTDVCEDPAKSALWLSVSRNSSITLEQQALALNNDLAHFPLPFFDARERGQLVLPMVLPKEPTLGEQRAAAILASYFGSQAGWRGARFPVSFDALPEHRTGTPQPAIVFGTNARRPALLTDLQQFPPVEAPTIELIDHPERSYDKLLLVLGRDDDDLTTAVTALSLGGKLFRGPRVTVEQAIQIQPRQPYDAPNWVRTDGPVRFAELIDYPEQLHTTGLRPAPITLDLRLPPDLFVWRNKGIPLRTYYRYNSSAASPDSHLSISINGQFIRSLDLKGKDHGPTLEQLRLDVMSADPANVYDRLLVPALKIGDHNRIRFDFNFGSTLATAQRDHCQTSLLPEIHAIIDEESTIDLSGYPHYISMPDLRAFARSGFPFSRMADQSETVAMVSGKATAQQVSTLLETVAGIAARTGYPALGLRLSANWNEAAQTDADLLLIGELPAELQDDHRLSVQLGSSRDSLIQARSPLSATPASLPQRAHARTAPGSRTAVSAQGPVAAIVGMQSAVHDQRSIVALLADDDAGYQLLRDTLTRNEQLGAVAGSVALIRTSGVNSQFIGEPYYVGRLPWWLLLWFHLSTRPVLLAGLATVSVLLTAFLVWRALRWVARRRLDKQA